MPGIFGFFFHDTKQLLLILIALVKKRLNMVIIIFDSNWFNWRIHFHVKIVVMKCNCFDNIPFYLIQINRCSKRNRSFLEIILCDNLADYWVYADKYKYNDQFDNQTFINPRYFCERTNIFLSQSNILRFQLKFCRFLSMQITWEYHNHVIYCWIEDFNVFIYFWYFKCCKQRYSDFSRFLNKRIERN